MEILATLADDLWKLVATLAALITLVGMLLSSNIEIPIGNNKTIKIGSKSKERNDLVLKDMLFRIMNDIDHKWETKNYEVAERYKNRIFASFEDTCFLGYFVASIFHFEIAKRIRVNNIKETLSLIQRYETEKLMLANIETEYSLILRNKIVCGLEMPKWDSIEDKIKKFVKETIDELTNNEQSLILEKLKKYSEHESLFSNKKEKDICVKACITKNIRYLENLGGRYERERSVSLDKG